MQNFSQTDRQKNNLLRKNLQPAFTLRQGLALSHRINNLKHNQGRTKL